MSEKKVLASGKFLRLCKESGWEYVERVNTSGVVAIVAVTKENKLLFVEQYRLPVKANAIEYPAGLAGDIEEKREETLEDAALRELEEETGFRAKKIEKMVAGPTSAGGSSTVLNIFFAQDLERTGKGGGEGGESITVHEIPVNEVEAWLKEQDKKGKSIDPKIYIGLYFLQRERDGQA